MCPECMGIHTNLKLDQHTFGFNLYRLLLLIQYFVSINYISSSLNKVVLIRIEPTYNLSVVGTVVEKGQSWTVWVGFQIYDVVLLAGAVPHCVSLQICGHLVMVIDHDPNASSQNICALNEF
jgi:hypothetical protein